MNLPWCPLPLWVRNWHLQPLCHPDRHSSPLLAPPTNRLQATSSSIQFSSRSPFLRERTWVAFCHCDQHTLQVKRGRLCCASQCHRSKFKKVGSTWQSTVVHTEEAQEAEKWGAITLDIFHSLLANRMAVATVSRVFTPWKWPHMYTQRCGFDILVYSKPPQADNEDNYCKSMPCSLDN